jgi:hypothetical protein
MSLAAKRVMCWIRGHDMGRWRRVPQGSVMYGLRVRKCKRCGMAEDAPVTSPRKRPATAGDTTQPL